MSAVPDQVAAIANGDLNLSPSSEPLSLELEPVIAQMSSALSDIHDLAGLEAALLAIDDMAAAATDLFGEAPQVSEPQVSNCIDTPQLDSDVTVQQEDNPQENNQQEISRTGVLSPAEVSDLMSLMAELQQRNGFLAERVTQLEAVLSQSQIEQQTQQGLMQNQDALLNQQSQELANCQEHMACLVRELECSHQVAQRQQILIETVTGQLETAQERVAQLERECSLAQQRYNEEAHLLVQSENTCRDLRSRLHRQQRYTLQFKAALEKCLEMPTPSYDFSATAATTQLSSASALPVFLPKVKPIQPLSTQPWLLAEGSQSASPLPDSLEVEGTPELETTSEANSGLPFQLHAPASLEPVSPRFPSLSFNLKQQVTMPSLDEAAEEASSEQPFVDEVLSFPETEDPTAALPLNPETLSHETEQELTLAQLLDNLPLEVLESCLVQPVLEEPALEQDLEFDQDLEMDLESQFSDFDLPFDPVTTPTHENSDHSNAAPSVINLAESDSLSEAALETDFPQESQTESTTANPLNSMTLHPNWPSPLIYSQSTEKKRKTLAAIELPSFLSSRS
ncbi:MAG: hypothetical protein VKJ46_03595 [Leptolyngbyaceae bacterium]|nr:hypothetical protein [Leptolyngbyaceae bacterium]